jgi:GT2 family glycosyltransferase
MASPQLTDPSRVREGPRPSLRIHSVLYGNDHDRLLQSAQHLERAADMAIAASAFSTVQLVYGDCSPYPLLDSAFLDALTRNCPAIAKIDYRFFDRNLGSAGGHNRLLEDNLHDCVLIMNPDVMLAPNTLIELARPLVDERVGLIEARQLPVEHPKEYDLTTGETSWASTACALIKENVIKHLRGFDAEAFFLYCDDVDFSWRTRLNGFKVIFQPSAIVFHDKRLSHEGRWAPSDAEKYYSAEAALMLAYKYSREDIVLRLLSGFRRAGADHLLRAAATFESRRVAGTLPAPLDSPHAVAQFIDGFYARHRFAL